MVHTVVSLVFIWGGRHLLDHESHSPSLTGLLCESLVPWWSYF